MEKQKENKTTNTEKKKRNKFQINKTNDVNISCTNSFSQVFVDPTLSETFKFQLEKNPNKL